MDPRLLHSQPVRSHRLAMLCLAVALQSFAALSAAEDAATEDAATLAARAQAVLAAGHAEEASELFARLTQLNPLAEDAWLGLAQTYERRGQPLAALEPARRAVTLAPTSAAARLTVGRLLARLGSVEQAQAAFAAARQLDPLLEPAYLLPALLHRDAGRTAAAVKLLEEASAAGAAGADVHEQLALLLLTSGKAERAAAVAQPVLAEHPTHAGLQRALGMALAALPDGAERAVVALQQALKLGVETPGQIYLVLGQLQLDTNQAAAAVVQLRLATDYLPELPEAHYRLALALRATGQTAAAAVALQRFQQLSRQLEDVERTAKELGTAFNEAQTLAVQNQLAAALERTEAILTERPDHPQTLALRGKVLFSMGRIEPALASLHRARQLDPGKVEYHYLEGLVLQRTGQPVAAVEALTRAVALRPDLGEAHALLGLAHSKLARAAPAVRHFALALELGAEGAELRMAYAYALESLGRQAESEIQFAAYRRLRKP